LGVELLGAYAPGIEPAFQLGVAAVRFSKVYPAVLKIHYSSSPSF
jgi:hypothetical protein